MNSKYEVAKSAAQLRSSVNARQPSTASEMDSEYSGIECV
jgi:hypothetical protein